MEFKNFKVTVQQKFNQLVNENNTLFLTDVDKDLLWNTYLNSFPQGSNNLYKERNEYDCNSCKQFIRPFANVVAIKDNKLISIWDIDVNFPFQDVANKLSMLVKSKPIVNIFVSKESKLGTNKNIQLLTSGEKIVWEHFYVELPKSFVNKSNESIESLQGSARDLKNVFKRSLSEITIDSTETVLELIDQGSLYRGDEFKQMIIAFRQYQYIYKDLSEKERDNYCWVNSVNNFISKIRNQAIGTLLIDISKGVDLDKAVNSFEKIMAPSNYKRPNAIITKSMINSAEKKIIELGLEHSLGRRYANIDDITINNVIFANRNAKKSMNASIFDELKEDVELNTKKFNKIEEVSIDDFINNIVPKATNIELLLEHSHFGNLMSLIAPKQQNEIVKSLFKWDNNFSWAYNGDLADSIKESVKTRGGKVDGVLRFSIMWADNLDDNSDLDAHCLEPDNTHIYFSNKSNVATSGQLDVDIQDPNYYNNKDIVENITWSNKTKMKEGTYKFYVNQYSLRGNNKGFTAEIEFDGQIFNYSYNKSLSTGQKINVAEVTYTKKDGFKIKHILDSTTSSKEIWSISSNKFHKVSMLMFSPNYWDGQKGVGNKHYFFILEGCKNDGTPRGFFNEYLKQELMEQKRVFEVLGSKMKVSHSNEQLSGLGFSSTQRNNIIAKVEGTFARTIKINF